MYTTQLNRRLAILGLGSLVLAKSAFAVPTSFRNPQAKVLTPEELELYLTHPILGTGKATQHEAEIGLEIRSKAPIEASPIAVAQYFNNIALGGAELTYQPYAYEWPERANPNIVEFFKCLPEGNNKISGDCTYWCAAFVNWCLLRANNKKIPDKTLIPGEFPWTANNIAVNFGKPTQTPVFGDLAAFKNPHTGRIYHTAFYVETVGDEVLVLGGNQGGAAQDKDRDFYNGSNCPVKNGKKDGTGGFVCITLIPKRYAVFKTAPILSQNLDASTARALRAEIIGTNTRKYLYPYTLAKDISRQG